MFSVGEKTMPTFRMLILLISELLMMLMRKAERARRRVKLALGSLFTRRLYAAILLDFSGISAMTRQYMKSCSMFTRGPAYPVR